MRSVVAVGTVLRADEGSVLVPTGPAGPDHQAALTLHGSALPPVGTRVVIEGGLVGRSLHVVQWRVEPESTSAWQTSYDVEGVSASAAQGVLDSLPEDWPIISVGVTRTSGDRGVVVLELDHATPEVHDWIRQRPPGSVHLITFVRPGSEDPEPDS
jgi:hypothetical protein